MKKYEIFSKIGYVIERIGVVMFLLSLCIDIDYSTKDAFKIMILCMIVSLVVGGIGIMLVNFSYIEGIYASMCIVTGASLYRILSRPIDALRRCDRIHTKLGSYKDTFKGCIKLHRQYVESLYYSDNNNEEVAKHE